MPGEQIAEAFVAIRPNTEGFAQETQRNIAGPLQAAFAGLSTAVVGREIGQFFRSAFDEATSAAKVTAQTAAVLKSTGEEAGVSAKHVDDLSNSLSDLAAIDDDVIQQGENVLLTFTNIRNEAGRGNDVFDRATKAALNMSAALGTDLQGSIIQVGKALQDPIAGLTALRRVGVSFTDSQKDMIAALVQSGDTLGAQKIILQELEKEFGGAAKSQATDAARLQVAYGNLKEAIGTALLPVVSALAKALTPLAKILSENQIAATALAVVISGALLAAMTGWTIRTAQATIATLSFKSAQEGAAVASEESSGAFAGAATAVGAWAAVAALGIGAAYGLKTAFTDANGTLTTYASALLKLNNAQLKQATATILQEGDFNDLKTAVRNVAAQSEETARIMVRGADLPKSKINELNAAIDQEVKQQERAAERARKHAEALDQQNKSTFALKLTTQDMIDVINGQIDASLNSQGAAVAMDRAIQNLNETQAENKTATLEGRQAVIDAEESTKRFGKAIYDESLAHNDAETAIRDEIGALAGVRDSLAPGSPLIQFLNDYIDKLRNQIPSDVHTNFLLTLSDQTGVPFDFLQSLERSGIPSFAEGGYIPARSGGTLIRAGEAGEGEYVVPESKIDQVASGGPTFNFYGDLPSDPVTYGLRTFRAHKVAQELAGR